MRMDTVSTMLTYSNFINNSKTLILEDIEGFITGMYAMRSSNKSNIVSLYSERIRNKSSLFFNLDYNDKSIISYVDMNTLLNEKEHFVSKRYALYFDKY
jgi:hypothetical protein